MPTSNNDEFVIPPSFDPRAVVCRRGSFANPTYDAELQIYAKQYVLSTGYGEYDVAMAAAKAQCDALKSQLLHVVSTFTSGLQEAKP